MPAAIDGQRSNRVLWRNRPDELPLSAALAFGDASWADYRVKATIRLTRPGEIGFRFRQVDDKNYYSFVVVPETGQKKIIKTTNGVSVSIVCERRDRGWPWTVVVMMAHGTELAMVSAAALAAGVDRPLLTHLPPEGEMPFGGW